MAEQNNTNAAHIWSNINPNKALVAQIGTSLIEAMLACALGIFVVQGALALYLNTKKSFDLHSALTQLQENARFATHFLSQNIRMAGDFSCEEPLLNLNTAKSIQGYQSNPPSTLKYKIKHNTDSALIRRCNIKNQSERIENTVYFVGSTSRKNEVKDTVHALYQSSLIGQKIELVPNIIDMRILYGLADSYKGDIQRYLPADDISDWELVRAVEIALLLRSEAPLLRKPMQVEFMGEMQPESRYLHRQWNTYINLREG